ncbi:MAG: hypothetical protein WC629_02265 [Candidatus Paceibacterota bacterium]|jgi:hypothetical protein
MKLKMAVIIIVIMAYSVFDWAKTTPIKYDANISDAVTGISDLLKDVPRPMLDKNLYDQKMLMLANNPPTGTSSTSTIKTKWPVKAVYPNGGALLPFNRIVAYYGNFYSTKMGALGEYPPEEMKKRLLVEVAKWKEADPKTLVIPAIHYIVSTAQGYAGDDGKYRLRMPDDQIQKAISLANDIHGVVFLDVQVGLSNVQTEVPILEKYLKLPNVHLALDPEFSMKTGAKPGTVIGTMDAKDINYATNFLADVVKKNNLDPKILIIHRFTQNMVTNYKEIKPLPEVQIVMDMDGWGPPPNKITTYKSFIQNEPVQFTGFKIFYKNDLKIKGSRMLTPKELMDLRPRPIYIQYQ